MVPSRPGEDDAPAILAAFRRCNRGGTVVLDAAYTLASPLDLTFLDGVDVALSGSVTFSDDIPYWTAHVFRYAFQDQAAFWRFGGRDVHIFGRGRGLLDGNGQAGYDAFAADPLLRRPVLLVLDGLHGGSVSGIRMTNPPGVGTKAHALRSTPADARCQWFNLVANSSDILVSDMKLDAQASPSPTSSPPSPLACLLTM